MMGSAWEVVLDPIPVVFAHWLDSDDDASNSAQDILLVDDLPHAGFIQSSFGGPPIVDEVTRTWLQARVSEWVSFHPLKVVTDPGVVQRLESQRARYAVAAPHALDLPRQPAVAPAGRPTRRVGSRY